MKPLPKQFNMKLVTVVKVSPAEIADALVDGTLRQKWGPNLSDAKKSNNGMLALHYIGCSTKYEHAFNFEALSTSSKSKNFLIHESIRINSG